MKYLLLISTLLIAACNANDNIAAGTQTENLSQEQMMKNAVLKYPDSVILKETLIQHYRDIGDYSNAIVTTNDALKKDSSSARLWYIKGKLFVENNDTTESITAFEKAVKLSTNPEYMILLGNLYAQTKNADALIIADKLLNINIKAEKESYFMQGLYYSATNEKEKAIVYFDKCLNISYTYMSAYTEKALALYDLKKYDAAVSILDKAITLQNSYDEAYYYKGMCLEKLNKPIDAIEAYHTALQYDKDYTEAKSALKRLGVEN